MKSRLTAPDRLALALASTFLGFALQVNHGFYDPRALALLGGAFALAVAPLTGLTGRLRGINDRAVRPVLATGVLVNLLLLSQMPIAWYVPDRWPQSHPVFETGIGAAAVLVLAMAVDPRRAASRYLPLLLLTYGLLGIWLIRASPNPQIDVMTVHRAAAAALRESQSPYSITFDNIYADPQFYNPNLVKDGKVLFGLPYPPFSLLMALPGELLGGDIRYAELAALLVGAAAVGNCARTPLAALSAALLLFTPRTFFVLEQGWTESLGIAWLGLVVLAINRQSRWTGIALGALCAVKQYLVVALAVVPLAVRHWRPGAVRDVIVAAVATAAVVTLPFTVWDPAGFWHSVVALQVAEPFRTDSLSVLAHLARQGVPLAPWMLTGATAAAAVLGLLLVGWRAPRSTGGFALSLGVVLLLTFAFGKKAFCNYYFLVLAAFAAALAADADEHQNCRTRQNRSARLRSPDGPPALRRGPP